MTKTGFTAEPGKQEVVITRLFDVPREHLFKAFTDPTLIPKWWADTTVDKMEVRPGGISRYIQDDAKGAISTASTACITRSPRRSGWSIPSNPKACPGTCS